MPVYNEKGRYRIKITGAVITDQEGKNPQAVLDLQLLGRYEHQYPPKEGEDTLFECNQPRFAPRIYLSLTEATMGTQAEPGWVTRLLVFIGFNGNFDEIASVTGWEGDASCEYQTYNDVEREKWNIIRPREASEQPHQADKKATRNLNTLFGKTFKAAAEQLNAKPAEQPKQQRKKKQPQPETVPPSNNGQETGPTGNDIPF